MHATPDLPARQYLRPSPQAALPPALRVVATTRALGPRAREPWENLSARLLELLGGIDGRPPRRAVFAGQVHGAAVREPAPGGGSELLPECDGLFTREPGTVLVIRTADCLPVVLWDRRGSAAAVLHAGWRGTYGNILAEGAAAFAAAGMAAGELGCWIGPSICGGCYEVSPELAAQFADRFGDEHRYRDGRLIDLRALNALQAERAGLDPAAIHTEPECTRCGSGDFPSHRRDAEARGTIMTAAYIGVDAGPAGRGSSDQEACQPGDFRATPSVL
ncbi:MAG: polyphenol oxidase family protein [Candidatus Sumerlaeia bacterium]|nr:polyphenol oxidase family protein [Candidatus Sumerlaeia bacterium]